MFLHTPAYLLFLVVTLIIYWRLPQSKFRRWLLLASSLLFYSLFDLRFSVLLAGLAVCVYFIGRSIPNSRYPGFLAGLSIIVNLSTLGLFKYANIFVEQINSFGIASLSLGIQILFPIGVSFYTFQGISYTTEIYRKRLAPVSSLSDLMLYLAFFPKLLAGPLVKPERFLQQLESLPGVLPRQSFFAALGLLIGGLVKKIVIADSLGIMADTAFQAAGFEAGTYQFTSPLFIQGFYLYAVQIYADFSGYTDIARASAQLFGFELPENFNKPYTSSTLTQFWNRWHMSLTQWFREYIFFPLSRSLLQRSNRCCPRLIQLASTLVTMLLIGWWHGASWTFIAWGGWHGILLGIEQLLRIKPERRLAKSIGGVVTFHLVGLGWVLFRAPSFPIAWNFYQGLFSMNQMNWLGHYLPSILGSLAFMAILDWLPTSRISEDSMFWRSMRHILIIGAVAALLGLGLLAVARGSDPRPFIYGQF